MTQTIARTAGIDISKEHLDACIHPDNASRRFVNNASGHRALAAWLARFAPERIVYEATGAYHRGLERSLGAKGLPLVKLNPRRARRFAEATGRLAKTDRIDAAMLARFGALLEPVIQPPKSQALDTLGELLAARRALIKDRTATLNRQQNLTVPLLKRHCEQKLKQIDAQLVAIDELCRTIIAAEPDLVSRCAILTTIPGIGQATAIAMLVEMPELGSMDDKQAASLAGLAPVTRQSGAWHGKSFIQGGRAQIRQALYMPALVAIRFNADLKAKYIALRQNSKAAKVAITAIMRKLVVLANALLRDNRHWSETRP
jgi:transposase